MIPLKKICPECNTIWTQNEIDLQQCNTCDYPDDVEIIDEPEDIEFTDGDED